MINTTMYEQSCTSDPVPTFEMELEFVVAFQENQLKFTGIVSPD